MQNTVANLQTNPFVSIEEAVQLLLGGQLVAMPTETVYGLAANALDDAAVAHIFRVKGRPNQHPLIVHIENISQIEHFCSNIPDFAMEMAQAFFPAPLTLIVPRKDNVATVACGGQSSIGLRAPSHPVAQALLKACLHNGIKGLAAPSANRFGRVSPTTAQHVIDEFEGRIPVLDGGACDVGIESTIVDCTRGAAVLLRPGIISPEQIYKTCRIKVVSEDIFSKNIDKSKDLSKIPYQTKNSDDNVSTPRVSGSLQSHYAPNARVRLMNSKQLQSALDIMGEDAANIAIWSRSPLKSASKQLVMHTMSENPHQVAHDLFAKLREFDTLGVKLIWIETPPSGSTWEAVHDRLNRAAA